jgi:hypothetical protein
MLPANDPRHKRVENRPRPFHYRGRIAIHAGLSRKWLHIEHRKSDGVLVDYEFDLPVSELVFGAVLGTVNVIDCVTSADILSGRYDEKHPWLRKHQHVSGPWCLILDDPMPYERPIPAAGMLGLWNWEPKLP